MEKIGAYAFLLGVIIAVIIGAAASLTTIEASIQQSAAAVLVLLGLVVGFLNIHDKETMPFLVASIALMFGVSGAGAFAVWGVTQMSLGLLLNRVLSNVAVFVIPAAMVVSLKAIWDSASK